MARRRDPRDLRALGEADYFFPNEIELQEIAGVADPADALRALANGRTNTIAKLGAARSNDPAAGSAADVFRQSLQPTPS